MSTPATTTPTTTPTNKSLAADNESKGSRDAIIGLFIFVFVVLVGVGIYLFEAYKSRTFIFAPYSPPPAPAGTFYPLRPIIPLDAEQIAARQLLISNSIPNTNT